MILIYARPLRAKQQSAIDNTLSQNYPNLVTPYTPYTTIQYSITTDARREISEASNLRLSFRRMIEAMNEEK